MAPPRPRTAANPDDSRSEASSSTKEQKASAAKAKKPGNTSASAAAMAAKAPIAQDAGQREEQHLISWSEMPLSLLHDYRQAYKLSTPSAYSNQYSQMLLSRGIGLRSPTSIAARRGQSPSRARQGVNGSTKNTETLEPVVTSENTVEETPRTGSPGASPDGGIGRQPRLHSIIGQSRVGKGQLALAVRKHFNSAGLVEQEAIARFLYKVREERRGHQFRLRFQL
jgi:hypothetical protein